MKEVTYKRKSYMYHEIQPTGTEKGKTFTRKSKGQVARDSRRYRQHLITKSVIKV